MTNTDLLMYKHAAQRTGHNVDEALFHSGYAKGEFHFTQDPRLLGELLTLHQVNLHRISSEWLAVKDGKGCFGVSPGDAVCRWVVTYA
jgi:hypothetical protein